MEDNESAPFYRHFWFWFVISIPMLGVVASSIAAGIAIRNPPDIVTGDYARLGRALVDTHARADRAAELGLSARIEFSGSRAQINLRAGDPAGLPDQLLLRIQHPVQAQLDQQVLMRAGTGGAYSGRLSAELPSRARIILSDLEQSWWLSNRTDVIDQAGDELLPRRL